ncbi:hypothetical protein H2248_008333 [Termitomyces sp. 'cryptogamus']|nr:hypothetical protein H2248_008333 [Termitomyces sp. 'cryptogamus']
MLPSNREAGPSSMTGDNDNSVPVLESSWKQASSHKFWMLNMVICRKTFFRPTQGVLQTIRMYLASATGMALQWVGRVQDAVLLLMQSFGCRVGGVEEVVGWVRMLVGGRSNGGLAVTTHESQAGEAVVDVL